MTVNKLTDIKEKVICEKNTTTFCIHTKTAKLRKFKVHIGLFFDGTSGDKEIDKFHNS